MEWDGPVESGCMYVCVITGGTGELCGGVEGGVCKGG